MKTYKYDLQKNFFIWAAKALIGNPLILKENLLIEVSAGSIMSIRPSVMEHIPEEVLQQEIYFLEEDVILMPGLIDAHVHTALRGDSFQEAQSLWEKKEDLLKRIEEDLTNTLNSGVVAIRDGGDKLAINLRVKALVEQGSIEGPKIIATGEAVRHSALYGSFLGNGISSPEESQRLVESLASQQVDQIKILLSGIVSFKDFGKVGKLQFNLKELQGIVETAHSKGLKVMAHASSQQAVELAIKAKVDTIEHGYFLTRRSLKEMAKHNITWVPTIIPVAIQAVEPFSRNWTQREQDIITRTYMQQQQMLLSAKEFGVAIGLGTDAGASGVKHGSSLLEEMLLYKAAGLSNQCILKAATRMNALALGLNTLGSIEKNKEPQFIGVLGNPLEDLNCLKQPALLFRPSR